MLKTKTIDRVCCAATALMIVVSLALWGIVEPARGDGSHTVGYESLLFDQSVVHTIDITMDGWDAFIANATAEEYTDCNIVIDGEKYNHVAIRAKGNTSLSSVATLGSSRYSFKVEFDHYVEGMTYHGLDKLSLNNMIQDATMMKDYLAYTLMGKMGVPSSLCSYVQINVNGEPWGLYLAVEGVEDAFMDRNGQTRGELYKPDSLSFGGGRGNGRDFDIEQFRVTEDEETSAEATTAPEATAAPEPYAQTDDTGASFGGSAGGSANGDNAQGGGFGASGGGSAQGGDFGASSGDSATGFTMPENMPEAGEAPSGDFDPSEMFGGGGFGFNFGMGSDDVKLVYTDDEFDSYSNIFNNAKTDVSKKDKTRLIEALCKLNAQEDLDEVVNKDEVITYLAVHNFLCNDDSYTGMMVHNYYLYEEKGKLSILPWDYNLAFGGFSSSQNATSTVNSPIDSPVTSGTTDSRPLIAWIFSDEDALAQYHEVYSQFISECIESGWLENEIARVQALITPYVENDPSAFFTMEAFNKAVDTLQTFCAKRGESIRGQLEGAIPSTSNGQRGSSALIDASEISTADMGSMGGTGGGGGGGFSMPGGGSGDSGFSMPDMGSFSTDSMPEGFIMPDGTGQGGGASFGGSTGNSANNDAEATAEPTAETTQAPAADSESQFGASDGTAQFPTGDGTMQFPTDGTAQFPTGTDGMDFTASAGTSAAPSASEATDQPADEATAQPNQTADSTAEAEATSRPSRENREGRGGFSQGGGMPSGMSFGGFSGGFEQQQDQTGLWIQVAVCAALLIAAIVVIRKAASHN